MGRRKGRGKGQGPKAVKEKASAEGSASAASDEALERVEEKGRDTLQQRENSGRDNIGKENVREKGEKREKEEKRETEEKREKEERETVAKCEAQESPKALVATVEKELESLSGLEGTLRAQVATLRRDLAKSKAQRDAGLERYNELLKAHAPVNLQAQAALVRSQAAHAEEGTPALSCCIAVLVMLAAVIFPFFLVPMLIVRQSVEPTAGTVEYVMERLFEPAVAYGS